MNLPGAKVLLPTLTEKDENDLVNFGLVQGVDFIAASFVRSGKCIDTIRKVLGPRGRAIKIIAKIENQEGLENYDEILEKTDGIMVARGDLGVEIPIHEVFMYQKQMVDKCNAIGKPVVVATQMLESMIKNPRPTRAEVSDIGNAVLDGADCVMLSGEVAQGKYPVPAVKTMLQVIKQADQLLENQVFDESAKLYHEAPKCRKGSEDVEAIAHSAVEAAHDAKAKLMIVLTDSGNCARLVAKYRPAVPVMCYATSEKVGRQLQVHRGLYPIVYKGEEGEQRPNIADAVRDAKELGWVNPGEKVVIVGAGNVEENLGKEVLLRVVQVE